MEYADVVELVDSLDLGSNARACRFESCHPHQVKERGISLSLLLHVGAGLEPIKTQQSGGLLRATARRSATIIFAKGENANRIPHPLPR